ncbi:MAG TPA: hypothetical protein VLE02_00825 [Nitrosarchaeum sp.]|nr:hypothetical protein [Nitrosarchaeum sp.]
MGISFSSVTNDTENISELVQRFNGSCDATCTNVIDNASIIIRNSKIGGDVRLTQTCSVNANCMMNSAMDANVDLLNKATNTAQAGAAWSLWTGNPFSFSFANISNTQKNRSTLYQSANEKCNFATLNQMNNVSILAENSDISGNVYFGQSGSTQGQCILNNAMNATVKSTTDANNTASSGKSTFSFDTVMYVIIAIVFLMLVIYGIKMYSEYKKTH